eukprot:12935549-Prorocentrum_lima.AAC.1
MHQIRDLGAADPRPVQRSLPPHQHHPLPTTSPRIAGCRTGGPEQGVRTGSLVVDRKSDHSLAIAPVSSSL